MTSINHLFKSSQAIVMGNLQKIFKAGATLSKKLDTIKLVDKVALSILKSLNYVPSVAKQAAIAATPFKDIKIVTDFFMGFRSLEALVTGKFASTWQNLALNTAGLSLMFFTVLGGLNRLQVDVSIVENLFKKIPFFNVLPYAGLLNLSLVTMFGTLYLMAHDKKNSLEDKQKHLDEKLNSWATFNTEMIEGRKFYYAKHIQTEETKTGKNALEKYQTQLKMWEEIGRQFAISPEQTKAFQAKKCAKWSIKIEKNAMEIKSCKLGMLGTGLKVISLVAVSLAILSGVGLVAATLASVIMGVPEAITGLINYDVKSRIENYKITPVKFNVLESQN